jgi:hypothetical protein
MTDKSKKTAGLIHSGSVTAESVKAIAESIGVPGLNDEVLHYISDDVTYRLKFVVQVTHSFSSLVICIQNCDLV